MRQGYDAHAPAEGAAHVAPLKPAAHVHAKWSGATPVLVLAADPFQYVSQLPSLCAELPLQKPQPPFVDVEPKFCARRLPDPEPLVLPPLELPLLPELPLADELEPDPLPLLPLPGIFANDTPVHCGSAAHSVWQKARVLLPSRV